MTTKGTKITPTRSQKLSVAGIEILRQLRQDLREDGRLDLTKWDHASPNYQKGRSNKQLLIFAHLLGGWKEDVNWDTVIVPLLMEVLVGR